MILFFLLTLLSCGKQTKTVSPKLNVISAAAIYRPIVANTYKDVIIYGNSSDGKWFTKVLSEESLTVEIPSGKWNFYAVSWESYIQHKFTGQSECAKQENVDLDEDDVNVDLVTKSETCEEWPFTSFNVSADADTGGPNLPILRPFSCSNISESQDNPFDPQVFCQNNLKGTAFSYQVTFFQDYNFGDTQGQKVPKLISGCKLINELDSEISLDSALRIPQNLPGNSFMIEFYFSKEAPCSPNDGVERAFIRLEDTSRVNLISHYLILEHLGHKITGFFHEINKTRLHNPANAKLIPVLGGKIKLQWNYPGDITTEYRAVGASNLQGVTIEACKNSQIRKQRMANTTNYEEIFTPPLAPGQYYVRICSTDGKGNFTNGVLLQYSP